MGSPARPGTHGFLVRVWAEPRELPGAVPRMAAWAQSLRTGEGRYVRSMAELEAFVRHCLETTGTPVEDWWPS